MRRALLPLILCACAGDLRDEFPLDGALPGKDHITHTLQADGSTLSVVDASNKTSFVYFDLDTGVELEASEAVEGQKWDMSFQRYKVSTNGGASGPGGVKTAALRNSSWEGVTAAPADGYQVDTADSVFTTFEGGWYYYDLGQHKLTPRTGLIYVVQSTEGAFFKIEMLGYYDAAGSAAKPSLRWAKLRSP